MSYPGFSEALCSPLMVNGSCEGIIYVHFDRGRVDFQDWTEPGLACLDELARILSIAIEIRGI
jgi:GAF domain-containing protein